MAKDESKAEDTGSNSGEYIDIYIQETKLHVIKPRKPTSWYRAIWKSMRSKKEERIYTTDFKIKRDGTFEAIFHLSPDLKKQLEDAGKTEKKIRFILPKGGAPLYAGKDLVDYIKAHLWKNRVDKKKQRYKNKVRYGRTIQN